MYLYFIVFVGYSEGTMARNCLCKLKVVTMLPTFLIAVASNQRLLLSSADLESLKRSGKVYGAVMMLAQSLADPGVIR